MFVKKTKNVKVGLLRFFCFFCNKPKNLGFKTHFYSHAGRVASSGSASLIATFCIYSIFCSDVEYYDWWLFTMAFIYKKLIRRWDSERELSLRRHCTRTKNTIDSCINSATDSFLTRRFTKFSEITQCNGHYVVQGHSRSSILVPI